MKTSDFPGSDLIRQVMESDDIDLMEEFIFETEEFLRAKAIDLDEVSDS